MGTTPVSASPGEAAELADLRRRAYGPDADIAQDRDAVARLAELERRFGRAGILAAAVSALPEGAPASVPSSVPAAAGAPAAGPAPTAATAEPASATGADPDSGMSRTSPPGGTAEAKVRDTTGAKVGHRRIAVAMLAAAAALVVAALASTLGPGQVTLYPRERVPLDAAAQLSLADDLKYLGIAPGQARLYDPLRGFHVWSAPRGSTAICLFVTSTTPPRWRVDCTPRNGEPTLDLVRYRDASRLAGFEAIGEVPTGTVLRLSLRNGTVVVQTIPSSDAAADGP